MTEEEFLIGAQLGYNAEFNVNFVESNIYHEWRKSGYKIIPTSQGYGKKEENLPLPLTTAFDEEHLYIAYRKCIRGVKWKSSTSKYIMNSFLGIPKTSKWLLTGAYKPKRVNTFEILSPKKREIVSVEIRDRVPQRAFNDFVAYPKLTKDFIHTNAACQKGKGTLFAIREVQKIYNSWYEHCRDTGNPGQHLYVLYCDIHGYYNHISHNKAEEILAEKLEKEEFDFAAFVLHHQYKGDVGYNPGSQLVQLIGISYLNPLDHYIKEVLRIKYYVRYMDDFVLFHPDKEYLKVCRAKIRDFISDYNLTFNPGKTRIMDTAKSKVLFLGYRFCLDSNGQLYLLLSSEDIQRQWHKLHNKIYKYAKNDSDAPLLTPESIQHDFNGWRDSHAKIAKSKHIVNELQGYLNYMIPLAEKVRQNEISLDEYIAFEKDYKERIKNEHNLIG